MSVDNIRYNRDIIRDNIRDYGGEADAIAISPFSFLFGDVLGLCGKARIVVGLQVCVWAWKVDWMSERGWACKLRPYGSVKFHYNVFFLSGAIRDVQLLGWSGL
jgi:hypothetical protein